MLLKKSGDRQNRITGGGVTAGIDFGLLMSLQNFSMKVLKRNSADDGI
jgi:hypothetical protein